MYGYDSDKLRDHIAQTLKRLRCEKGFTQEKLAELLHVSDSTVSAFEHGQIPGVPELLRYAELFGTDMNTLTGLTDVPERIALHEDEIELIRNYRRAPDWVQDSARHICRIFAEEDGSDGGDEGNPDENMLKL